MTSNGNTSLPPGSWLCTTPCANSLSGGICTTRDQCERFRDDPVGAMAWDQREQEIIDTN